MFHAHILQSCHVTTEQKDFFKNEQTHLQYVQSSPQAFDSDRGHLASRPDVSFSLYFLLFFFLHMMPPPFTLKVNIVEI